MRKDLQQHYPLSEVATSVGRSMSSIYRDIEQGRLKATKVGGQWRVSAEHYDEYVRGDAAPDPYDELRAAIDRIGDALSDDQRLGLMSSLASGRR